MPGYAVRIPAPTNCKSGPAIIYHAVCTAKRPECKYAHYVGVASTNNPSIVPMASRWSNHKSHHKWGHNNCKLANHLISFHKGEDAQTFVKLQILQEFKTEEEARSHETWWMRKLFSFSPTGLNVREEQQ